MTRALDRAITPLAVAKSQAVYIAPVEVGAFTFTIPTDVELIRILAQFFPVNDLVSLYCRGSRDGGANWMAAGTDYNTSALVQTGTNPSPYVGGFTESQGSFAPLTDATGTTMGGVMTLEVSPGDSLRHPVFKSHGVGFRTANGAHHYIANTRINSYGRLNAMIVGCVGNNLRQGSKMLVEMF